MILLGPPVTRFGTAGCTVVGGLVGVVLALRIGDEPGLRWLMVVVLVLSLAGGGLLCCRALRLGVVGHPDHLVVRGLFRSRRIDSASVFAVPGPDDVTALPQIGWHDRGRRRRTPVLAFWVSAGPLAGPARRSAARSVARLNRHLASTAGRRRPRR